MTKANIMNGWRNPNEDPEMYGALLVVYAYNQDNSIFRAIEYLGIKHARNREDCTLLAWQYLPEWEKEEED